MCFDHYNLCESSREFIRRVLIQTMNFDGSDNDFCVDWVPNSSERRIAAASIIALTLTAVQLV